MKSEKTKSLAALNRITLICLNNGLIWVDRINFSAAKPLVF